MTTPITVTLESLLVAPTQTSMVASALGILGLPGSPFPTAAWQATDAPYVLVTANAVGMVDVGALVPALARGGLLGLSEAGWLTLLAASNFEVTRAAAVSTIRALALIDASGSPTTYAVGDIVAVSAQGTLYTNTAPGTLTANGTLVLPFQAQVAGAAGDAASGPWTAQVAIPGVSITESTVYILQHGSDEEGDDSVTLKAQQKWGTLGSGANDDAYAYWAKTTPGVVEVVTRVAVLESTPLPGQVTLYLATDSGPVSSVGFILPTEPTKTGTGTVSMTIATTSGFAPFVNGLLVVRATTSGAIAVADLEVSIDGGATFVGPIASAATVTLPDEGVALSFTGTAFVAGDTWTTQLIASTTGLVQTYIDPADHTGKAASCVDVFAYSAPTTPLVLAGTITLKDASTHAAVVAGLPGLATALAKSTPIGGTLYGAVIMQKIIELPGVINFSPLPADVTLSGANILAIIGSTLTGLVVTP